MQLITFVEAHCPWELHMRIAAEALLALAELVEP